MDAALAVDVAIPHISSELYGNSIDLPTAAKIPLLV